MFWKKKPVTGEPLKQKVKKLSPKEIISNQIEQLGPAQSLSYKLPETFGGGLAIIELNPQYPGTKGQKKYNLSRDELVDGKPAGKRRLLFGYNDPMHLASWIVDQQSELFIGAEEG